MDQYREIARVDSRDDSRLVAAAKSDRRLRVAIICGGQSAEHEVSLLSARFVLQSLDTTRFIPVVIGIDKQGKWFRQPVSFLTAQETTLQRALIDTHQPISPLALFDSRLEPIDVVFPVLHGPHGEDGKLQGMLDIAGVPYVGAGVLGSAVGMDKDVMKRLLIEAGIPVAKFMMFRKHEFAKHPMTISRKAACLGFPLFTKPANLGSSVGVSKVTSRSELRIALEHAFEFDDKVLVEEGIAGREIECAVLGSLYSDDGPIASVAGEVIVGGSDGFYSYRSKYIDEQGAHLEVPANLNRAMHKRVQRLALRTFEVLECDGLARVDFFLAASGALLVNEINTLPGFTAVSMYPKLCEASGVGGGELVTRLIELALARHARRSGTRSERVGGMEQIDFAVAT